MTMAFLLFWSFPAYAKTQHPDFWERIFFYKDIHHFVRIPTPSPSFHENLVFKQTFVSRCDRLNRIIIPFYSDPPKNPGKLTFNLYVGYPNLRHIYSTEIDPIEWPLAHKMGTHALKGIFHNIWLPIQPNSRGKQFTWEVLANKEKNLDGTGIYLTQRGHPQIYPIQFEKKSEEKFYGAFYAYCHYPFDWLDMRTQTWRRIERQKNFLFFYFATLFFLCIAIRCNRDS